jgi:cytidylate kinase
MNKSEKFVITINRELGSGGHTIGRKLAEKLGVKFYDRDALKVLEEKFHLSLEEIEQHRRVGSVVHLLRRLFGR